MKKTKRKPGKTVKYNPKEWDDSASVIVEPEKRGQNELSTSIRLPKHMVAKLRTIASRKGDIGYQTLIKIWIAERLEEEAA